MSDVLFAHFLRSLYLLNIFRFSYTARYQNCKVAVRAFSVIWGIRKHILTPSIVRMRQYDYKKTKNVFIYSTSQKRRFTGKFSFVSQLN